MSTLCLRRCGHCPPHWNTYLHFVNIHLNTNTYNGVWLSDWLSDWVCVCVSVRPPAFVVPYYYHSLLYYELFINSCCCCCLEIEEDEVSESECKREKGETTVILFCKRKMCECDDALEQLNWGQCLSGAATTATSESKGCNNWLAATGRYVYCSSR